MPGVTCCFPRFMMRTTRHGWLPPVSQAEIAERLGLGPAEVFGVASFYGSFALEPRPPRVRRVCIDVTCLAMGAVAPDGRDPAEIAAPCLGRCEHAPAVLETDRGIDLAPVPDPAPLFQRPEDLVLLRRVGAYAPHDLDGYLAVGGYGALENAAALGAPAVRAAIGAAALVGRGGAAFPAGRKWDAVAAAEAVQKYVVANADESEPGTFKDRVLSNTIPSALIEAMTIAGWAVGARRGRLPA